MIDNTYLARRRVSAGPPVHSKNPSPNRSFAIPGPPLTMWKAGESAKRCSALPEGPSIACVVRQHLLILFGRVVFTSGLLKPILQYTGKYLLIMRDTHNKMQVFYNGLFNFHSVYNTLSMPVNLFDRPAGFFRAGWCVGTVRHLFYLTGATQVLQVACDI